METPRGLAPAAGLAALIGLCLLAAGGAARTQSGIALGVPSGWAVLLVACLAGVLAVAAWRGPGLAAAAGLALPVPLLLAGLPLEGLRAVSGPALFALAGAGVALALCGFGWKRSPRLLLVPAAFALFVVAGGRASVRVGPQGDEPHYLMVAESLLRDGDVSLESDYREQRYASFHDVPLEPHFRVRGRGGEVYSLHALGLSVLVLPAWAVAGYAGVTVFMALLAALLVREIHALSYELSGREDAAFATAVVCALSPPLLPYAGLVFTEVPAALLLTFALRRGRSAAGSLATALAVGLAVAALPWLNVRYAPLAVIALVHALWRTPRLNRVAALLAPAVVSALALTLYHHALYGFWDPTRVYGRRPEFAWSTLLEGVPGLLFDQEFGLLVHAPVLVLALPGLLLLLRRDLRLGVSALAAVAVVIGVAGSWHMWRGGFNPAGRFLVPIVPVLLAGVALVWSRRGSTVGAALLVGWGIWIGIGGALEPQLVHRDREDTAPFFRVFSGAREWTGLLPGYVLEHPDRHRLAGVWAAALLLAVPWRARRPSALRAGLAALCLVAAAQVAATVSGASQTGDRDAVRLAGRPSLQVPGWRTVGRSPAVWLTLPLGWGPLYEPHRHPGGAILGRRLPVPPGRYRLDLELNPLGGSERPLAAWWSLDRPGSVWRPLPCTGAAGTFTADWRDLRAGRDFVNLRLHDGPPALIAGARLVADDGQGEERGQTVVDAPARVY